MAVIKIFTELHPEYAKFNKIELEKQLPSKDNFK
jgi:hypothetical protein